MTLADTFITNLSVSPYSGTGSVDRSELFAPGYRSPFIFLTYFFNRLLLPPYIKSDSPLFKNSFCSSALVQSQMTRKWKNI